METLDFLDDVNYKVKRHVRDKMTVIRAHDAGLDPRAGYRLYINESAIAVDKNNDHVLQYYAGYEYVDKEFRQEYGDYVFYLYDEGRVTESIDHYYSKEEDEVSD